MKAVDLFCGAGGASLGLHHAGYDVTGFDYWQPAIDTHQANGIPAVMLDLSSPLVVGMLPDAPLWWASPPCQPFSAAGDGAGEDDSRDGFPWLLRLVALRQPEVLIVENVKGLTFDKHTDYFQSILAQLRALGYEVRWAVLNSADYGVPQTRERCFIIARRDGGPICWPTVTHTEQAGMFTLPWVTMADALGWGMNARPAFTVPARESDGGPRMDGAGGSGARAMLHAERDAGRWVLDCRASDEAMARDLDPYNEPSQAVTTVNSQWQWVAGPNRVHITIPELARLQGFPPDWYWTGTKTSQARQVGNAVPPIMAELLATINRPHHLDTPTGAVNTNNHQGHNV